MSGVTGAVIGSAVVGAGTAVYGADKAAGAAKSASKDANAEQARQFDIVRGDTSKLRGLGDSAIGRINRLYGYGSPATAPAPASPKLSYGDFIASEGGLRGFSAQGGRFGGVMDEVGVRRAYQQYLQSQPAAASVSTAATGRPDMSVFFESPDYQLNLGETQKSVDRSAASRLGVLSGRAVAEGQRRASGLASGEFASFYDRLAQQAGLGVTGIGQSAAAGANAANNIGASLINAGNNRASAYMTGASGVNSAVQGGIGNYMLYDYLRKTPVGAPGYGG